jgi:hypothetical protein
LNPLLGPKVSFEIMALTFKAAHHVHTVSAFLERLHEMDDVHFAGTGKPYDPDAVRITQTHGTCQVRSFIASVDTAKRNYYRSKFFHILYSLHEGINLSQNLFILVMRKGNGLGRTLSSAYAASLAF